MKRLFMICQLYKENSGSYSGFFEQLAKYAFTKGYKCIIVTNHNHHFVHLKKKYAEIVKFPSWNPPIFSFFFSSIIFSYYVKQYFKKIILSSNDIIIANGKSALGLIDKKFFLRASDQPGRTFLSNMEISKNDVTIFTRFFRFLHICLLSYLEMKYIPQARGLIYPSNETRNLFEQTYDIKKPYFIPHASVKSFSRKKRNSRIINILFISAKNEKIRKGVILLEKALPKVFLIYSNVYLTHVGKKYHWNIPEKFKSRINSVGAVPWESMGQYYSSSDCLICCSIHEMFPNVVMEALATGLPVICSNIQGVNEYINHKVNGYIYERGNVEGIIKAIDYFINHKHSFKLNIGNKIKTVNTKNYNYKLLSFLKRNNEGISTSYNLLK